MCVFVLHTLCLYVSHVQSLDEWLFYRGSFLFHYIIVNLQKAQGLILTVVTTL